MCLRIRQPWYTAYSTTPATIANVPAIISPSVNGGGGTCAVASTNWNRSLRGGGGGGEGGETCTVVASCVFSSVAGAVFAGCALVVLVNGGPPQSFQSGRSTGVFRGGMPSTMYGIGERGGGGELVAPSYAVATLTMRS